MNSRQNSYRQVEDVWRSKRVRVRSLLMSLFLVPLLLSLSLVSLPCLSPLSLSLVSLPCPTPLVSLPCLSSLSYSSCLSLLSYSSYLSLLSLSIISLPCPFSSCPFPVSLPRLSPLSLSVFSLSFVSLHCPFLLSPSPAPLPSLSPYLSSLSLSPLSRSLVPLHLSLQCLASLSLSLSLLEERHTEASQGRVNRTR